VGCVCAMYERARGAQGTVANGSQGKARKTLRLVYSILFPTLFRAYLFPYLFIPARPVWGSSPAGHRQHKTNMSYGNRKYTKLQRLSCLLKLLCNLSLSLRLRIHITLTTPQSIRIQTSNPEPTYSHLYDLTSMYLFGKLSAL